jgi:hypothetical protein
MLLRKQNLLGIFFLRGFFIFPASFPSRLQEPPGRAAVQVGAENTNGNKSFEFVPILP